MATDNMEKYRLPFGGAEIAEILQKSKDGSNITKDTVVDSTTAQSQNVPTTQAVYEAIGGTKNKVIYPFVIQKDTGNDFVTSNISDDGLLIKTPSKNALMRFKVTMNHIFSSSAAPDTGLTTVVIEADVVAGGIKDVKARAYSIGRDGLNENNGDRNLSPIVYYEPSPYGNLIFITGNINLYRINSVTIHDLEILKGYNESENYLDGWEIAVISELTDTCIQGYTTFAYDYKLQGYHVNTTLNSSSPTYSRTDDNYDLNRYLELLEKTEIVEIKTTSGKVRFNGWNEYLDGSRAKKEFFMKTDSKTRYFIMALKPDIPAMTITYHVDFEKTSESEEVTGITLFSKGK